MKGKAALLPLVTVWILVLGVAIFGPIQAAAAQDYEHNWSWLVDIYTRGTQLVSVRR
jgi:hypothetical protein